jgi:flagellar assembly protein FliH
MTRRFVPDQFDLPAGSAGASNAPVDMPEEALEEARLAAFDQGFKAGWEDCEEAAKEAAQAARGALLRHLQEMSFGYHEAHGHLLAALRPVFTAMVDRILPAAARQTLGPQVVEALMPLAQARLESPVRLYVHPESRLALEEFLSSAVCPPFETVEDAALPPGAVRLAAGETETLVDPDSVTEAIREIVARHLEPRQEKRRHG